MICPDCTVAKSHTWGGYSAHCNGCKARAAARSLAAKKVLSTNTPDPDDSRIFSDLIARLMPSTPTKQARALVCAWWHHDHPKDDAA